MGYVYRYKDISDNIIKYVGIVWSDNRRLKDRIYDHQNDYWFKDKQWKIEYIDREINSRTDAEYLEAHFISLYQTDKWYNKSKAGWGISAFIDVNENEWKEFQNCEIEEICNDIFSVELIFSGQEYQSIKNKAYQVNLTVDEYIKNRLNSDGFETDNSNAYLFTYKEMINFYKHHPESEVHFMSECFQIYANQHIYFDGYMNKSEFNAVLLNDNNDEITHLKFNINDGGLMESIVNIEIEYKFEIVGTKSIEAYEWLVGKYTEQICAEEKLTKEYKVSDAVLNKKEDDCYQLLNTDDDLRFTFTDKNGLSKIELLSSKFREGFEEISVKDFIKQYGNYSCVNIKSRPECIEELKNQLHSLKKRNEK